MIDHAPCLEGISVLREWSSRSSSFNDSAAEIILGLFRTDIRAKAALGAEYDAEEDPSVRDMLIRTYAQNPDSWVSKRLASMATEQVCNDSDSDGDDNDGDLCDSAPTGKRQ